MEEDRFILKAEIIPSYIPVRVAERILFVGESVQMFEKDVKENKYKPKGKIFVFNFYILVYRENGNRRLVTDI